MYAEDGLGVGVAPEGAVFEDEGVGAATSPDVNASPSFADSTPLPLPLPTVLPTVLVLKFVLKTPAELA